MVPDQVESSLVALCFKLLDPTEGSSFHNWLQIFEPDKPRPKREFPKDLGEFGPPLYYASCMGLLSGRALDADVNGKGTPLLPSR